MEPDRKRIAILGAGPVGLDAALAAHEAGHPFTVYEAGEWVGEHLRRWGHVRLFTPWSDDVSPRMRRALEEEGLCVPDSGACPTGEEVVTELLEPLAGLPRLAPHIRTGVRVVGVSRRGRVKSDAIGAPERGDSPFRILLERRPDGDGSAVETVEEADVVLDCTGTYSSPNALGDGGVPAPGERAAGNRIVREIPGPDLLEEWRGDRVLLVGAGHSAQTAARDLAGRAGEGEMELVWAVRAEEPGWGAVEEDPLAGRSELVRASEALVSEPPQGVEVRTGVVVDAVEESAGTLRVLLRRRFGGEATPVEVDWVVSLTGYVGDHSIYRQLQVHECWATTGPMKLAAALLGSDSADCLDQTGHGAESLMNPEPGFFLLGAKSYGRNNTFLLRVGWEQVDDVFSLLRAD